MTLELLHTIPQNSHAMLIINICRSTWIERVSCMPNHRTCRSFSTVLLPLCVLTWACPTQQCASGYQCLAILTVSFTLQRCNAATVNNQPNWVT